MRTHRHWVQIEGTLPSQTPDRIVKVTAGSNISEADALKEAERRLAWLRLKVAGARLPQESYEADIREQVLETPCPGAVITRNRQGAQVLNCEALPILDIDEPPSAWWQLFAKRTEAWRLAQMTRALEALTRRHQKAGLGFRLYRTAKGFRVIVLGHAVLPQDPLIQRVARALHVDPLYWTLCLKQGCYRARLTPKAHRMGVQPIRVPFPPTPASLAAVETWEASIQERASAFRVCEFLETFGPADMPALLRLHDKRTGAFEPRPLA